MLAILCYRTYYHNDKINIYQAMFESSQYLWMLSCTSKSLTLDFNSSSSSHTCLCFFNKAQYDSVSCLLSSFNKFSITYLSVRGLMTFRLRVGLKDECADPPPSHRDIQEHYRAIQQALHLMRPISLQCIQYTFQLHYRNLIQPLKPS